jgi:ammonium transporter Rh
LLGTHFFKITLFSQNISGYLNDVIAMVGTLFLFLYWPSFNAALASVPQDGPLSPTEAQASSQFLSIVNTLLSLLGSTIATFAISALTGHGRLNMMHVQNSSLAGGVAMVCNKCILYMTPLGLRSLSGIRLLSQQHDISLT